MVADDALFDVTMCHSSLCMENDSNVDSRDIRINCPVLGPPNRMAYRTTAVTVMLCYFTYLHKSNLK